MFNKADMSYTSDSFFFNAGQRQWNQCQWYSTLFTMHRERHTVCMYSADVLLHIVSWSRSASGVCSCVCVCTLQILCLGLLLLLLFWWGCWLAVLFNLYLWYGSAHLWLDERMSGNECGCAALIWCVFWLVLGLVLWIDLSKMREVLFMWEEF